MNTIKELFDKTRNIYRTIEKVITYKASQENRLKSEISEYIATESIEEQFERLLENMQTAMRDGGKNEIGVWVSGFYGSGKSSFTKYFGLSFDDKVKIDGIPFKEHLKDRFHKPQTKALLLKVTKDFPAAVVLLDLASEMLAGATMEDVSTVLFYKVLQFAGYSKNLKVAALERKLQKDGRYEEFQEKIFNALGTDWVSIQNDPLVVDSMIPEIAHQLYPELFKTPASFNTNTIDFVKFENERVQEMLEIIHAATGKEYVIFVLDEVGQYIGSRQNLILNLQGLAENLQKIGRGKAWIICTAQQTLTEDSPRAALNAPELYKLKDRFPIKIELESKDIKEICYKRLLGKSPEGEKILEDLFDQNGQALRHNTKLQDAKHYDSDFNKQTFINLYPFLPAHFDILLHLLGVLAKSTGGYGLRSAIKVIQDILIEKTKNISPAADQPIGNLATTTIIYDSLEKEIRKACPSIYQSLEKTLNYYRDKDHEIHRNIAKTTAVLQVLENMPVTVQNIAGLMHPSVSAPSFKDEVEKAVEQMIKEPFVPFGEQDGNLCLFSEKLDNIAREMTKLPLRTSETARIFNEILKETFNPLPGARVEGSLVVKTGLKFQTGSTASSIAGDRETIQTIVNLCRPEDFETARTSFTDESRQHNFRHMIYLIGKKDKAIDEKTGEIYRSSEMCSRYRNEPDQEVKKYFKGQDTRVLRLKEEVKQLIKSCLSKGIFIFRGQAAAVDLFDQDVVEACKKYLADAGSQVFDKYSQAPVRVETSLAEKFLKTGNLNAITSKIDPLGLIRTQAGKPFVRTDHKALLSIRDYIDRNGSVEGKRLIEHFTGPPFGWSPDTLRYLLAAYLVAGEIKLKVSGREVTVNGQQAVDALKTNNSFKSVGVSLRQDRPSIEVLARAEERMTELAGETILPLEDEISKTAVKQLPRFQSRFASLGEKLVSLNLPGSERVHSMIKEIADILFTDASDAPVRLGAEESALYENLKWAGEVYSAFAKGLENTIKDLQMHMREIQDFPQAGVPGRLQHDLLEELTLVKERLAKYDFYKHAADLNSYLTNIKTRVSNQAVSMAEAQKQTVNQALNDLSGIKEWEQLSPEEQSGVVSQVENFLIDPEKNLSGFKKLIAQEFNIHSSIQDIRSRIISKGIERAKEKEKKRLEKAEQENIYLKKVPIPDKVASMQEFNQMIDKLKQVRADSLKHDKFEIFFVVETQKNDNRV